METIYLYLEYIKTFIIYIALLYIWPCIIFRKYLKGRGLTFRYLFCTTVQIALVNTVVLILGLFHILNPWVVRGLFWGSLIISIGLPFIQKRRQVHTMGIKPEKHLLIRNLLTGTCGWKMFLMHAFETPRRKLKNRTNTYQGKLFECFLLLIIVSFGVAYFSSGPLQLHSYGTGDLYVHHEWIRNLQQGKIFSDGVYPEAMHCFIYGMVTLLGANLYSCILFLGAINTFTILLAIYLLLKEVFRCHYTPLFVLAAWLTFDGGVRAVPSVTRLTWTLPQEFGLYLVFLCPLLLLRFLRRKTSMRGKNETVVKEWFRDENLLLFAPAIANGLSIHFYVLILAFFACLPIVIVYFRKIFSIKNLRLLIPSVLYGIEIGGIPMAAAFVVGINLQGSLRWGMSTFKKTSSGFSEATAETAKTAANFSALIQEKLDILYNKGLVEVFGETLSPIILAIFGLMLIISCIGGLCIHFRRKKGKTVPLDGMPGGYAYIALLPLSCILMYATPSIGAPTFVEGDRIVTILQLLVLCMFGSLIDFFFLLPSLRIKLPRILINIGTFLICGAIYYTAYTTDFHKYNYWWLKSYNSAVALTTDIIKTHPKFSYTIVSTDNELFQVYEKGRHEELLDFVKKIEDKEYYIPTEYVFLYVEKKPIMYSQMYFYSGPSWLAQDSDSRSYNFDLKEPRPEISEEAAEKNVTYIADAIKNYNDLEIRTALNSKLYAWCQDFAAKYPLETSVYFEDDEFVCYLVHQNTLSLFNLSSNSL